MFRGISLIMLPLRFRISNEVFLMLLGTSSRLLQYSSFNFWSLTRFPIENGSSLIAVRDKPRVTICFIRFSISGNVIKVEQPLRSRHLRDFNLQILAWIIQALCNFLVQVSRGYRDSQLMRELHLFLCCLNLSVLYFQEAAETWQYAGSLGD